MRAFLLIGKLVVYQLYMKKFYLFALFAILLGISTKGSAQVTFTTMDDFALPDDSIEVDIIVDNFTSIVSTQFAVIWNPDVLSYRNVKNFSLDNLTNDMDNNNNFGFAELDTGKLRFSWADFGGSAVSLSDGTVLYTIVFDVVGDLGDQSEVLIGPCESSPPLPVEVGDANGNPIDDILINVGTITIGTNNTNDEMIRRFSFTAQPNPFKEQAQIKFNLDAAKDTNIRIYDITGRKIFEQKEYRPSGDHTILVEQEVFSSTGIYFYQLETVDGVATRSILLVE